MKVVRLDTGKSWEDTMVSEEEADELDIAIAQLEQLKKDRDAIVKRYKLMEDKVIDLLDERDEKTHVSPFDGGWQVTKVVAERIRIDEQALAQRIGNDRFLEYATKRVFDRARLENAVGLGIIHGEDVAECSTVEQNTPYLRLTRHREQEPEESAEGSD